MVVDSSSRSTSLHIGPIRIKMDYHRHMFVFLSNNEFAYVSLCDVMIIAILPNVYQCRYCCHSIATCHQCFTTIEEDFRCNIEIPEIQVGSFDEIVDLT
jgi:hypothetical protein